VARGSFLVTLQEVKKRETDREQERPPLEEPPSSLFPLAPFPSLTPCSFPFPYPFKGVREWNGMEWNGMEWKPPKGTGFLLGTALLVFKRKKHAFGLLPFSHGFFFLRRSGILRRARAKRKWKKKILVLLAFKILLSFEHLYCVKVFKKK